MLRSSTSVFFVRKNNGNTNTYSPWGPCTFFYASPEQAKNEKPLISFRSDFFALGTIIYELATGAIPFGAFNEHGVTVLQRIVDHDPPALDEFGFSSQFSSLVSRMMSKQPYLRPRRVEDLQSEINQISPHNHEHLSPMRTQIPSGTENHLKISKPDLV